MTDDQTGDNETEDELEYLCAIELFEIEQAFLDAVFDDDGNEVKPE